jgi:hypothetical protein
VCVSGGASLYIENKKKEKEEGDKNRREKDK